MTPKQKKNKIWIVEILRIFNFIWEMKSFFYDHVAWHKSCSTDVLHLIELNVLQTGSASVIKIQYE